MQGVGVAVWGLCQIGRVCVCGGFVCVTCIVEKKHLFLDERFAVASIGVQPCLLLKGGLGSGAVFLCLAATRRLVVFGSGFVCGVVFAMLVLCGLDWSQWFISRFIFFLFHLQKLEPFTQLFWKKMEKMWHVAQVVDDAVPTLPRSIIFLFFPLTRFAERRLISQPFLSRRCFAYLPACSGFILGRLAGGTLFYPFFPTYRDRLERVMRRGKKKSFCTTPRQGGRKKKPNITSREREPKEDAFCSRRDDNAIDSSLPRAPIEAKTARVCSLVSLDRHRKSRKRRPESGRNASWKG